MKFSLSLLILSSVNIAAQTTVIDLFSEADMVVQGEISYDTTYLDGQWAYTSYIIEPCTILKDSQGSRSKPLAITRMGGMVDGTHYSRPHGLYIFGGEQALFFLKLVEGDEITPESFTSVVPISYDNGFTKYLTDDWKPVVPIEDSLYSAGDFRSTVNEIIPFEYCSSFESKYVIAPKLTLSDDSVSLAFRFGYESHNQLPAAPASLEIHFRGPVALDLVDEVSISLNEGVEYSLEAINSTTWTLAIEVDSFDFYLEDLVQVVKISLSAALISQLGSVEVKKGDSPRLNGKSFFSRIVYEEDVPKGQSF